MIDIERANKILSSIYNDDDASYSIERSKFDKEAIVLNIFAEGGQRILFESIEIECEDKKTIDILAYIINLIEEKKRRKQILKKYAMAMEMDINARCNGK